MLGLHKIVAAQHADHKDIGEKFSGAPFGGKAPLQIVFNAADKGQLDAGKGLLEGPGLENRHVRRVDVNSYLAFGFGSGDGFVPIGLPGRFRVGGVQRRISRKRD